ncbi:hypothetical protein ACFE04_030722 [Oxalis oulophora]
MSNSDQNYNGKANLYVFLFGAGTAALVYSLYRCVAAYRYGYVGSNPQSDAVVTLSIDNNGSLGNAIPAFKFQKGKSLVGEDFTCPVCLAEFDDDEELRTLPECNHTYHVPCIDMWLCSHTSCPLCRKEAIPPEII